MYHITKIIRLIIFENYRVAMLYGEIPSHINPYELVRDIEGTKRLKEPLVNGIIYILSTITYHTLIKEGRQEYVILNKELLDKIIGKGRGGLNRVKFIIDLLKSNGLIETIPHVQYKHKSTGYKLKKIHKSDLVRKYPYGERISEVIENILSEENGEYTSNFKYEYLEEQFTKHTLEVDEVFVQHLHLVAQELLKNSLRKKELKYPSLLILINYVGRLLTFYEKLNNGQFSPKVSLSNHRFTSVFTQTPKILREYIRINDSDFVEIDIKSCQPYLLSTILFPEFSSSTEENDFSFKTIFPKLHSLLEGIGFISLSNDGTRNHKVLYCYLDDLEFESINQFRNIDFTNDYYEHIVQLAFQDGIVTNRDKVKDKNMTYLFGQDEKNRKKNLIQSIYENHYHGLNRLIERFNFMWKNKEFAILLQRTESYILLKRVLKEINTEFPNVPIFTIHDGVYTSLEFGEFLRNEIKNRIEDITSKPIGIHFSRKSPNIVLLRKVIIENTKVNTFNSFEFKSKGVFKNHVEKGYQFLFPNGNDELRTYINEFYS
jgi:hypothetical protein